MGEAETDEQSKAGWKKSAVWRLEVMQNIPKVILFALVILLSYPVASHSASARQQAKQKIASLTSISTEVTKLQASAKSIVIKKKYCLVGTGTPTKTSTYTNIAEHRTKLNTLIQEFNNVKHTVNLMRSQPGPAKLIPAGTPARISNIQQSILKVNAILRDKKKALDNAPTRNCMVRSVKYEKVDIPNIPEYVCTKKEKQAFINKAVKAVRMAEVNTKKAHADADRYNKAKGGKGKEARAVLDKLFNRALKVYRKHKKVLNRARAVLKAAKRLKVVKCDKNGVIIVIPGLERSALKTQSLVRPATGACDECKPEQVKYNAQVNALTRIRNKIARLVRRYGAPRGKVPPKVAVEYRLLMKEWNAKYGLLKEFKRALDICIEDKCSPQTANILETSDLQNTNSEERPSLLNASTRLEDLRDCGVGFWSSREDIKNAMRSSSGLGGYGWEFMGVSKACPGLGSGKVVDFISICNRFDSDIVLLSPVGIPLCWDSVGLPPSTADAYKGHWGLRGLTLSAVCWIGYLGRNPTREEMMEIFPIVRYSTGDFKVECFYMKVEEYTKLRGLKRK